MKGHSPFILPFIGWTQIMLNIYTQNNEGK